MMQIENHRIKGERIDFTESPNHGELFNPNLPDTIIIHYTAGSSKESSVSTLCDSKSKASAHLVVGRDGSIAQLVPFNAVAWHAGKSQFGGRIGFNKYSIGIEIDNAGKLTKSGNNYSAWFGKTYPESDVIEATHRHQSTPAFWHKYSEEQISAVMELCRCLVDSYNITAILGHEEISPVRKIDPGPAFPLDKMRERLLIRDRAEEGREELKLEPKKGIVTASRLNFRSQPLLSAMQAGAPLMKGTQVEILNESQGWYNVEVKTRGWVKKDYVKAGA